MAGSDEESNGGRLQMGFCCFGFERLDACWSAGDSGELVTGSGSLIRWVTADAAAGRHGWIAGPSPAAIGRDGMQIYYRSGPLGPGNHDDRKRVAACYRP
ncbi:hypothetical protein ACLOJK_022386 [Asimina triloba]